MELTTLVRILFIIDSLRGGGKERRFLNLLRKVEEENIEYKLIVTSNVIEYEISSTIQSNLVYINRQRLGILKTSYEIYKFTKKFSPNIIHTWSNSVTFCTLPCKIFLKIKLINSQITNAPPKILFLSFLFIISKINFYFSDLIVANSYSGIHAYNVNPRKSKVIYNGIDLDRFDIKIDKNDIKKSLGILTKYVVVMVASFTSNKDFKSFIRIASEIEKIRNDVTFLAVGDGANLTECKKYAKSTNNIFFLGRRNDIEVILKACDIGILLSPTGEGTSNSILEYMSSSIPVIANRNAGNEELSIDGLAGYLVDKIDYEKIADIILRLLMDTSLRIKLGTYGKLLIKKKYSNNRNTFQYIKLYNQLNN